MLTNNLGLKLFFLEENIAVRFQFCRILEEFLLIDCTTKEENLMGKLLSCEKNKICAKLVSV